MAYDLEAPGVHVRGFAEHATDDRSVSRLTVQVWPLPTAEVVELNRFIGAAVASYLEQLGLASGEFTDLSAKGLPQ